MAQEIFKSTGFKVVIVIALIVIIIGFVTNWTFKFKKYAMGGRAGETNPVIHPVLNPAQIVNAQIVTQSPLCNELMQKINQTQNENIKSVLTSLYNIACSSLATGRSQDFCSGVAGAREQLCTGDPNTRDMCQFVNGIWNKYCQTGSSRVGGNDAIACAKKCDKIKDDNEYRTCMANCTNS